MAERFAIGIDYGTESGRVMLTSIETGEEAAWALVPYKYGVIEGKLPDGTRLNHEWALQDPRDYLRVIEQGVPQVMEQSGVKPEQGGQYHPWFHARSLGGADRALGSIPGTWSAARR